ncbi:hypothetical protein M011DRAFT_15101 [Sporormia fimetaria CBS 119925]|uniref:Rhodopsin domain-containing protein n=1 Tax=Sporormia fimetaria CBS 119925 TaxID=1340428 RepID=A0A6A6VQJ3_9PLEO|nr:hypothetical protein M011DRAFT_15101 [Sporormia fimetaria CBS 119925]
MEKPIENEGPHILGATLTVTIVALISTIMRLFVRIKLISNVGWDDLIMVVAMVLVVVGQCIIIPQVMLGAGKHIGDIDPIDFQQAFKLNFITQPIYLWAICLVKISIGFFLLRVAVQKFYRRLIIGVISFMAFYTLGCFFTIVLQCDNLEALWDPTVKASCWDKDTLQALSYTNVGLNIFTDLLFAIFIPIPMLWNVQMNRRQKISIMGILSLGIFCVVAAIIKLTHIVNYGKTGDWLWDSRDLTIWTVVECCIGIIAGNLPTMKPLFRRALGSTYGFGSRNTNPKYFSHQYGNGTDRDRTLKNYNSLGSGKTGDQDPLPGVKDAHMMSAMNGDIETRAKSPLGARKDSEESDAWLGVQQNVRWDGITKTTDVTVSRTGDGDADSMKQERKEAHIV